MEQESIPGKYNILDAWRAYFYVNSSFLSSERLVDRKDVDFIYNFLIDFWGEDFFNIDFVKTIHENNLHFIQALVYKADPSCFYRLREVVLLIEYAKTSNTIQFKKLKTIKSKSDKLKDILVELLTEIVFKQSNIQYIANEKRQHQELEGYCLLNGVKFLVECKNRYSVVSDDLMVIMKLVGGLLDMGRRMKYGLEGIGYLFIQPEKLTWNNISRPLKYFKGYMKQRAEYSIDKKWSYDGIDIEVRPRDLANNIEYNAGLLNYSVAFRFSSKHKSNEKGLPLFWMDIKHNVLAKKEEVAKKLIDTVEKARGQHRNETAFGRIFVIFNEFMNDFVAPLLLNCKGYDNVIQEYLESKTTNDIVILVNRRFNAPLPSIDCKVLCKSALNEYKEVLDSVLFYIPM